MKKNYFILFLGLSVSIFSCKKDTVDAPTFDAKTDKTEYKVGDTVKFNFSGNADVISFYSGETGKEYKNKDRVEAVGNKLKLAIATQGLYASQTNNLKLFYSTDFSNTYSVDGIKNGNWKDISSKFTFGEGGTQVASGDIDISDLPETGKPIYFAFKFAATASATAATGGKTWRVYAFNLSSTSSTGAVSTLATIKNAGWIAIDVENPVNKWAIASSDPALIFAPNSTLLPSEDWAISGAFYPNKVNPDTGTGIKVYVDALTDYKYVFTKAGTYIVTFVAKSAYKAEVKEVVKQITLTIK
jgi:hypothetical protein